jgi:hypothetical protein
VQVDTGRATEYYQTPDGTLLTSDVTAHGTQTLYENGSYSNGGPLTLNTDPDRYTCSGSSPQISAPDGASVDLTRDVPRASGS